MRIAIFDYLVTKTNAIGSCHLRLLDGLCHEHDFVVFAREFENPVPSRIEFVRISVPRRPLVGMYLAYHALAPLYYAAYRLRTGLDFDLVQTVETNLGFGDLAYSHFCHRAFLRDHWSQFSHEYSDSKIRRSAIWALHRLHSALEPRLYRRVQQVVVPSAGLAREMAREYPASHGKVQILPNAIDAAKMQRPPSFDRAEFRKGLGFAPDDFVLIFVAHGHFERKGLPLVIDALSELGDPRVKLLVVGGEADTVCDYTARIRRVGVEDSVTFYGKQQDVKPFLWSSDAFILASIYEVFPLVVLEAAAASLPIIVSRMNGVEDFLVDRENGVLVERSVAGVAAGIVRVIAMSPRSRREMSDQAAAAILKFGGREFVENWRHMYQQIAERL